MTQSTRAARQLREFWPYLICTKLLAGLTYPLDESNCRIDMCMPEAEAKLLSVKVTLANMLNLARIFVDRKRRIAEGEGEELDLRSPAECEADAFEETETARVRKLKVMELRRELGELDEEEEGLKPVLRARLLRARMLRLHSLLPRAERGEQQQLDGRDASTTTTGKSKRDERHENFTKGRDEKEIKEIEAGAKGSRPLEITRVLGPVALRRLRLAPGVAPPWLTDGFDFENVTRSEGDIDVLDAHTIEWEKKGRGKKGGRQRSDRRRSSTSSTGAGSSTLLS
jgi:hypothetical protein